MLLFHPVAEDALDILQREGIPEGASFVSSLEEARRESAGAVLVVDAEAHPALQGNEPAPALAPSAFENLAPSYRPPEPVTAAGGYVLRTDPAAEQTAFEERPLLLIYRRGVWDLPKGKQDPGEDVRTCALREVREETGLGEVRALGSLGSTVHGYADTDAADVPRYAVKTTHWFLMATSETDLTPERGEGIEEAVWVGWRAAGERLGYRTLRRHHRRAAGQARALLDAGTEAS